jgi:hypothetical protein
MTKEQGMGDPGASLREGSSGAERAELRPQADDNCPQDQHSAGRATLTAAELDRKVGLSVVRWEGRLHCAYLNDHRVAGGKPWGGGDVEGAWDTTLRDVICAFPELQRALGFDYLGREVAAHRTGGGR